MSNTDFSKRVRSRFVAKGTTLTKWAIENGLSVDTAHKAVRGDRKGPKSMDILRRIKEAL